MENKNIRKDILEKVRFCCSQSYNHCVNSDSPVFLSKKMRQVSIELKKYNAAYYFCFCPWCHFHYYDLETAWNKNLLKYYKYNSQSLQKTGIESLRLHDFENENWWINKKYFDLTKKYDSTLSKTHPKTFEHEFCCDTMYELLNKNGHDSFRSYIKYIPNIRTYIIMYKTIKHKKFAPINHCPFCGITFPSCLENELTKIFQTEFNLYSWKDLKKAPKEFQTDEWWKKRGL